MTEVERRIVAAQGYLELGLLEEAREQIASLPPLAASRPDVIELDVLCCMAERRWEEALSGSMRLCALEKNEPGGYIHAAYCLHELGRTGEAREMLRSGPGSLRKKPVFYYNLGCYSARLGLVDEALRMLEIAFEQDPELRRAARKDPDLQALKEQLR